MTVSPTPHYLLSPGKFKLEDKVRRGIFFAHKSYTLEIDDQSQIVKRPEKHIVTSEWFIKQFTKERAHNRLLPDRLGQTPYCKEGPHSQSWSTSTTE